jgi:hypothetical protein
LVSELKRRKLDLFLDLLKYLTTITTNGNNNSGKLMNKWKEVYNNHLFLKFEENEVKFGLRRSLTFIEELEL